MIISKITGGLGNQMFQCAAGRAMSLQMKSKLSLDTSFFKGDYFHSNHENKILINLFPKIESLHFETIDDPFVVEQRRNGKKFANKIYNFIYGVFGTNSVYETVSENQTLTYQADFHSQKTKNLYLIGDWQNENYFLEYESDMRNDFKFPKIDINSRNGNLLDLVCNNISVSIHIRRGDYLSSTTHTALDQSYYKEAINIVNDRINNPVFFVFSDDIDWCKSNLNLKDAYYVDNNFEGKSYVDMQLMSNCNHNIIANSSFSWWGAWLNDSNDKIVISPKVWLPKLKILSSNVIPAKWISI